MITARHRTAIKRTAHSKPYQLLIKKGLDKNHKILDMGCGHGFDVDQLRSQGFNIVGYDKYQEGRADHSLLQQTYDLVTCNYVFNVIEDPEEREQLLHQLRSLGKQVLISVRADRKAIKETWKQYADGNITPINTFQKFYSEEDVDLFFGKVTYLSNTANEKIFLLGA